MNQPHKPGGALQAELEALGAQFEAEDREDRRTEAERRRKGLPESERDIWAFDGFADARAAARDLASATRTGCQLRGSHEHGSGVCR